MTQALEQLFIQAFPALDTQAQQQGLQLYQQLAKGKAISVTELAKLWSLTETHTKELLDSWTGVAFDQDQAIKGFWGVDTEATSHCFYLNDTQLYTWCAWDLLFMPHIYKQTIKASTVCPISGQTIQLSISEQGIETVSPAGAMITFIEPELSALKANVTQSFCQYIFFVASEAEGEQWKSKQENGFLMSMHDGFELGKKIIQTIFKDRQ